MTNESRITNIDQLTSDALDAFWNTVVSRFPKSKFGDVSPERSIALSIAAEDSITEWVTVNTDIDRKALRNSAMLDLTDLAKTCRSAFHERLATLREERTEKFRHTDDLDDIDDQIGHYEALVKQCDRALEKTAAG